MSVTHAVAQRERIHRRVEELRAELADDRQVDPVLDLGERIGSWMCRQDARWRVVREAPSLTSRRSGACCRRSLVALPVPRRALYDVAFRKLLERACRL